MRTYSSKITLVKNSRGVWDLDTIKGCSFGTEENPNGCYDSCYAVRLSKRSGVDFSIPVKRYFSNRGHLKEIINQLKNIDTPFVRIGTDGDPSHDWYHTFSIIKKIKQACNNIVIVTKHWNPIPNNFAKNLSGIYVNTSISALDSPAQIKHRLAEYEHLKPFCYSILRVNTCKFNVNNSIGKAFNDMQLKLLDNVNVLDTILRFPTNHNLVESGVVIIDKTKYLKSEVYASVLNDKTYFGTCDKCPELCGIGMFERTEIKKQQLKLF